MLNEANAVYTHSHLVSILAGTFLAKGIPFARELYLPNRKIADFIYSPGNGTLHIIECKVDFRPGHLTEARYHYGPFCHYLWVAIPSNSPPPLHFNDPFVRFASPDDKIGIVAVSNQGMGTYRPAQQRAPNASDIEDARTLFALRLTAGERAPRSKTATAAEPPKNSNAGH